MLSLEIYVPGLSEGDQCRENRMRALGVPLQAFPPHGVATQRAVPRNTTSLGVKVFSFPKEADIIGLGIITPQTGDLHFRQPPCRYGSGSCRAEGGRLRAA
jgi:hypothetical protein